MTFSHRFTHYFVEFCCDRLLRTFLKVVQKKLQQTCSKRGEGGSKAVWTMLKKTALLVFDGFPYLQGCSPAYNLLFYIAHSFIHYWGKSTQNPSTEFEVLINPAQPGKKLSSSAGECLERQRPGAARLEVSPESPLCLSRLLCCFRPHLQLWQKGWRRIWDDFLNITTHRCTRWWEQGGLMSGPLRLPQL